MPSVWLKAAGLLPLLCAVLSAVVTQANAQAYPVKPIRIIVGFPAASGADFVARTVGQRLSSMLGQSIVVENRTGAAGTIATGIVAAAAPDGYTLLQVTAAETAQSALRAKMQYNLERDFSPIALMALGTFVLVVHPSVPADDMRKLISLARAQPGKLNYGSSGPGSSPHLAATLLKQMTGIAIVDVAYKGATEAVTATVSGEVDMSFPSITAALPLMQSGRLRVIAVTSAKRATLLPDVPTVAEAGVPGFERSTWHGLIAPGAAPREIVSSLNNLVVKIVGSQEVRDLFGRQGLEPQTSTPEEFAALIKRDIEVVTRLIRATGAKAR